MINVQDFINLIWFATGNSSDFSRPYTLQLIDQVHRDLIVNSETKDTATDLSDSATSYFDYPNMNSLIKEGVMIKLNNGNYGSWLANNGLPDFKKYHGSNVTIVKRDSKGWL